MRRKTSADYFAVAAVICSTPSAIAACETEIQEIRASLGVAENFEFHFARIKDRHRREFLTRVSKCDFTYAACYLDKAKLVGQEWRDKRYFYEKIIGALADASVEFLMQAQSAKGKALKAKVVVDDNNDPIYFKVIRERFRSIKAEGKSLVDKVGPGRSRSSNMLQLADMICGSMFGGTKGREVT